MPDMPRTKFNSPWTVANIEAELNGTKSARGALTMTEKLAQKVETSTYATDKAALDAEIETVADELTDHTTIHELLNTMPYTTLTSYADSLGIGEHFIAVQNNNNLADVPFNNSFAIVVVRSYSENTAAMEFTPLSTTYQMYRYTKIKTAGVWREWYRFTGDAVAAVQSVPASLTKGATEMSGAEETETESREEERR